jgi:Fur family peroxide stress response transcriptional regulator
MAEPGRPVGRHEKLERLGTFARLCRQQGLPLTSQRRTILEELLGMDEHPDASAVHRRVARRLPGTSRTTVYRTLETLVAMGLVAKTCHSGRSVRYDRRIDPHHHLLCVRCERVDDIDDPRLDSIPLPDTSAAGFAVIDHRVLIRGVCRHCRDSIKEEGP